MSKRSIKRDKDYPIFQAGVKEGRQQMQLVILGYLEERYSDRSIVRGSTLAKAILEVAADLAKYLRGLNAATLEQATTTQPGVEKSE